MEGKKNETENEPVLITGRITCHFFRGLAPWTTGHSGGTIRRRSASTPSYGLQTKPVLYARSAEGPWPSPRRRPSWADLLQSRTVRVPGPAPTRRSGDPPTLNCAGNRSRNRTDFPINLNVRALRTTPSKSAPGRRKPRLSETPGWARVGRYANAWMDSPGRSRPTWTAKGLYPPGRHKLRRRPTLRPRCPTWRCSPTASRVVTRAPWAGPNHNPSTRELTRDLAQAQWSPSREPGGKRRKQPNLQQKRGDRLHPNCVMVRLSISVVRSTNQARPANNSEQRTARWTGTNLLCSAR